MSGQNALTASFTTCLLSYCGVLLPYDVSANDVSVVGKVSFYLFCLFCNCANMYSRGRKLVLLAQAKMQWERQQG